jgi:hypothetical protein
MGALSAAQLTSLAQEFTQFATTINNFLNQGGVDDDATYTNLSDAAGQAADIGANLAVKAAATTFADSASAFQQLIGVTTDANNAAKALTAEAASLSRGIKIAAGMLSLGGALITGNIPNVLSSISAIHDAVAGS